MIKGFAPKQPPRRRYWMQVMMSDGSEQWTPLHAPMQRHRAYRFCAEQLKNPAADYVLLLRGGVEEGAISATDDILADFQREAKPGAKVIRV